MNGSISGNLSPAIERAKLALSRQVYTLRPWTQLRSDPTTADSAKGSVAAGLDNCSRGPIYSGMRPRAVTAPPSLAEKLPPQFFANGPSGSTAGALLRHRTYSSLNACAAFTA